MNKKCSHCKKTKPLEAYYNNTKSPDGHDYWCKECKSAKQAVWTKNFSKEKKNAYLKKRRLEKKKKVVKEYGGKCTCCGEIELLFLSIDHLIYGHGSADRRKGLSGEAMYDWLIKNSFPKDKYQILCFNCNLAKGFYGNCPHNNCQ